MVDETCMTLLGVLGGVVVSEAVYIVKLWTDRDKERRARIRYLEDMSKEAGVSARDTSLDF